MAAESATDPAIPAPVAQDVDPWAQYLQTLVDEFKALCRARQLVRELDPFQTHYDIFNDWFHAAYQLPELQRMQALSAAAQSAMWPV